MNTKLDNIFLLAFFVFIGIAILVGVVWIVVTEKRLKRLFLGKKGKDLEDTIITLQNEIRELSKKTEIMQKEVSQVSTKIKKSIRGLETIRFNPFTDQGSNQSFAISMVNEEGDGVILSSLYSRDRMSIFAKPIKNNKSEYELTTEEKEALKKSEVK